MAEGRFLSRNIAFSEQLGQVSLEADYLFMRMLPHLDCEGRLTGSPKSIRARVCPLREDVADGSVAVLLAELDQARLINWYEIDGMQCVEYPNFEKYQVGLRKDREAPSKIPASSALGAVRIRTAQPIPAPSAEGSGVAPDAGRSPPDNSKGSKGKLREGKVSEVKTPASGGAEPQKRSRKSDQKYPHYPTDVCTQLHDTYRRTRGPIDYAAFRRETHALFPTDYTTDQLIHALEAWGEWVSALPAEKARWERASTWITNINRWVRLGAMPLIDDLNGLTERGRLAAGAIA